MSTPLGYTAKQNYPGLVTSYDTQSGNEACLFYNASKPKVSVNHCVFHCGTTS